MQALSAFNIRSLPCVSCVSVTGDHEVLYERAIHSLVVYCILKGLVLNTENTRCSSTKQTSHNDRLEQKVYSWAGWLVIKWHFLISCEFMALIPQYHSTLELIRCTQTFNWKHFTGTWANTTLNFNHWWLILVYYQELSVCFQWNLLKQHLA